MPDKKKKQTRIAALVEDALATTAYPKKSVSADVAESLVERLDACARRLGRRKSQIVAEAIRDACEEMEEILDEIDEAAEGEAEAEEEETD